MYIKKKEERLKQQSANSPVITKRGKYFPAGRFIVRLYDPLPLHLRKSTKAYDGSKRISGRREKEKGGGSRFPFFSHLLI